MSESLTGININFDAGFENPPQNPLHLLGKWLHEAKKLNVREPYACTLSTVDNFCKPSSRIVLIREWDNTGVYFGTSKLSNKGKDIAVNHSVAGNLYWRETMLQVSFQGNACQCDELKSDQIFLTRTRNAQAVAVLSRQSHILLDQEKLKKKFKS